jgi:tetratricopeptide (TPR) repeat protein
MRETMDSFVKLFPYMNSELKFKDPQFEKLIQERLDHIVTTFKTARHVSDFKKPGLAPNYQTIANHLEDTLLTFNSGNKDFARVKLNTSLNLCMSCHTQIPKDQLSGYIFNKHKIGPKTFENPYEYANFLLILRKYDQSLEMFEKTLRWRKSKHKEMKKVKKILGTNDDYYDKMMMGSLRKILLIFTKIKRSPEKALEYFSQNETVTSLPQYAQNEIKDWKKTLKKWKDDKVNKINFNDQKEVKRFLDREESRLRVSDFAVGSGEFDIDLLMTSGIASNFMMRYPNTELSPQIMYLLGIAENRLNKNIFFTIGDLYLKDCVRKFPKDSYAKKCLAEYSNEIKIRFTGSLGTDIPSEKQKEIKELEKLIQQ